MKRWLFGLFCLMISWVAFSKDQLVVKVAESATQFFVILPSNPTTGYRWILKEYDQDSVQLVNQKYIATTSKRLGSGGNVRFLFEFKPDVKGSEKMDMVFYYVRPWESHPAKIMYVVIVKEKIKKKS